MVPVIGFVASSANAGKTTLIEKLIKVFKARGIRVGVIKHTHHQVEPDLPGKDTWRFEQAGAETVALISNKELAIFKRLPEELTLDSLVAQLGDLDLILVEGYKKAKMLKVEVFQKGVQEKIVTPPEELLAIVGNETVDYFGIPWYSWNDHQGIAELIVKKIMMGE